ncbi:hypothetical protein B0F90DRAFT_1772331 [Multifurca ochricompacta]|uniref:Uncharacterized protein n=1 Tax=Multifurca ochricompacta TaxID=376703 RepID=A0AAD4QJL8_9AGAM|nr:hypothetical protein B0F90DRAFT_1772331 [Multifurca ochricompacta]
MRTKRSNEAMQGGCSPARQPSTIGLTLSLGVYPILGECEAKCVPKRERQGVPCLRL